MKKEIVLIIIGAMIVVLLNSCSSTESSNTTTSTPPVTTASAESAQIEEFGFAIVSSKYIGETGIRQHIVYDVETNVMYSVLFVSTDGYEERGAGLTVTPLYDADGTLRLYDPGE